jgi:hypothetical protein
MFPGLMSRWMMPRAVGMTERIGNLARDAQCVVQGQLALARQSRAQRLAAGQRHHVVQHSAGVTGIEQRKNVRML